MILFIFTIILHIFQFLFTTKYSVSGSLPNKKEITLINIIPTELKTNM